MSNLSKSLEQSDYEKDSDHLMCPECGFEYAHLDEQSVRINDGSIYFAYVCEESHRFSISFMFHKGYNFISTEVIKQPSPESKDLIRRFLHNQITAPHKW